MKKFADYFRSHLKVTTNLAVQKLFQ